MIYIKNIEYKKITILAIVLILLTTSLISNTSAENKSNKIFIQKLLNTDSEIDWWPTFQHDTNHTGHSTSDAPETANLLWSYTFSDWGIEGSSPAVVNNKVYFGVRDSHKVYCLDIDDGSEIWTFTTGEWIDSSPTVVDSKVFIGSADKKLYCLNANDGSKIWTFTDSDCGEIDSSPAIVDINKDGTYEVFFSSVSTYCLNAETGNKIWKNSNYETHSSPVVTDGDKDGEMEVYLGDGWSTGAVCLKADTGEMEWTSSLGGSSPTVIDDKILVCSDGVHCLDITDGSEIWSCLGEDDMSGLSVALWNNKVYATVSNNKVYCRNLNDGSELWTYTADKHTTNSPIVVDKKVYIGLGSIDGGKIICINAENGNEYTNFNSPSTGNVYATMSVADSKLFVGANDLYCFSELENQKPEITITKPVKGIYLFNNKLLSNIFDCSIAIGKIDITAEVTDDYGVDRVEFKIDDTTETVYEKPYTYCWKDLSFRFKKHTIRITAYDIGGLSNYKEITVRKLL